MNAVTAKKANVPTHLIEQIHELDHVALVCRDLKHAYAIDTPYYTVEVEGGVRGARYLERKLGCMRCPVTRTELVRVHEYWLERLSVYYTYPKKGYRLKDIPKGTNVLGMIRFEQFRRATEGDAA